MLLLGPELLEREREGELAARLFEADLHRIGQLVERDADTLAQLYAQAGQEGPRATEQALRLHPNDLAPVMSLAFAMETGAVKLCGAPSAAADSALLLIARSHAGANQ